MGGIEFSTDADGKGQYRVSGASEWIPFLKLDETIIEEVAYTCFINGDSNSRIGINAMAASGCGHWNGSYEGTYMKAAGGYIHAKIPGYYLYCNGNMTNVKYEYFNAGDTITGAGATFAIKLKEK